MVAVIPELDLVIVHRVDTYNGENVPGLYPLQMVDKIVEAQQLSNKNNPVLIPMESKPLTHQHPNFEWPQAISLSEAKLNKYAGQYQIERGPAVSVSVYEDGLFGVFPGRGEAELLAITEEQFFIRIDSNISMRFSEFGNGVPNVLSINFGGQIMQAKRVGN